MKKIKKILLIGFGNIGSIIAREIIKNKIIKEEDFYIIDKDTDKVDCFFKNNCNIYSSIKKIEINKIKEIDLMILAIKPQDFNKMKFSGKIQENTKVLSVMAGVNIAEINDNVGVSEVFRIMPNTPMSINKGVIGYYFSKSFIDDDKKEMLKIIENLGVLIKCEKENQINSITAISGSGPAYFYRILEIFQKQAIEFGFSKEDSKKIVLQTMLGAGLLAEISGENFSELRKKVTSKGGTTQKAIEYFDKNNLEKILIDGILEAKKRANEL